MSLAVRSPYGHPLSTGGVRAAHSALTLAALVALPATDPACTHGNEVFVDADQSTWVYNSACVLTSDNLLVAGTHTTGRWVRKTGACKIQIPIPYATADAAILATIQAGFRFRLLNANWKVTTTLTTGTAAAAGISSSNGGGATTKGDLLGGATGDVVATLVSTGKDNWVAGTVGAQMDTVAHLRTKVFVKDDTIRYDLFTGTFTGGVFYAELVGILEANPMT